MGMIIVKKKSSRRERTKKRSGQKVKKVKTTNQS
jgi:hypothetical protein